MNAIYDLSRHQTKENQVTLPSDIHTSQTQLPWIGHRVALSATQLDASSNGVPGTITYSEAGGTVLKAGTYTLSAEFVPTSSEPFP